MFTVQMGFDDDFSKMNVNTDGSDKHTNMKKTSSKDSLDFLDLYVKLNANSPQ